VYFEGQRPGPTRIQSHQHNGEATPQLRPVYRIKSPRAELFSICAPVGPNRKRQLGKESGTPTIVAFEHWKRTRGKSTVGLRGGVSSSEEGGTRERRHPWCHAKAAPIASFLAVSPGLTPKQLEEMPCGARVRLFTARLEQIPLVHESRMTSCAFKLVATQHQRR
jgi:hypothetical protein